MILGLEERVKVRRPVETGLRSVTETGWVNLVALSLSLVKVWPLNFIRVTGIDFNGFLFS